MHAVGRAIAALLLLSPAWACSGRILSSDLDGGASTGDSGGATIFIDAAAVSACMSSEGVRICGGSAGCPWLDTTQCPGGCTTPLDRDGTPQSAVGVCWSDAADKGSVSCAVCDDGEGCLQRTPDQLVCIPIGVCESLWGGGATSLCRYADKSAYDDEPLPPEPTTCPTGVPNQHVFCGGACGACGPGNAQRCIGRSPKHPVGICANLNGEGDPNSPSDIPTCSIGGSGVTCPHQEATNYCGVFAVASVDQETAQLYGVCIDTQDCLAMQASLPGGFSCLEPQ
jgi:hypothetical protein